MTALAPPREDRPATPAARGPRPRRLLAALAVVVLALVAVVVLSLTVGAKMLTPGQVWGALAQGPSIAVAQEAHTIVWQYRVPRTVLGLLVGSALALAGALVQGFTRNPLADPGILGVNAGAALAVILAIAVLGATGTPALVLAAILGAGAATGVVVLVGSLGRGPASPIRMTLSGIAVGAFLSGFGAAIRLGDPQTFDRFRVWAAGTLLGRTLDEALTMVPFLLVGGVLALACARGLNAIALGEDLASSLGTRVRRTRTLAVLGLTLLAGAATAVAGPIGFVGLMVPHAIRWILGPDQRLIIALSAPGGAVLLLASDVLARVVLGGAELPVGVVTAFVGAPLLIALARRKRVNAL